MNLVMKVKEVEAIQYTDHESYLEIKKKLDDMKIDNSIESDGIYIFRDFDDISERLNIDQNEEYFQEDYLLFIMQKGDWIVFTDDRLGFRIYTSKEEMMKYYDIN